MFNRKERPECIYFDYGRWGSIIRIMNKMLTINGYSVEIEVGKVQIKGPTPPLPCDIQHVKLVVGYANK